jgi:lipopolysaccharide biosynthesis glycosyltransferase
MLMKTSYDIYVGYDSREPLAFDVCVNSILKNTSNPTAITIHPLRIDQLRRSGVYYRPDDPLSSTEFTFSRFLVPFLQEYKGKALFCDSDFLFIRDVVELFELFDSTKAIQCCMHDYNPSSVYKMEGAMQHLYPRKNWSSLVLYNCEHESNQTLTTELVNNETGQYLHRFQWLKDEELGELSYEWNWLVGWYKEPVNGTPKALHFTEGGPWHKGYENCEYADIWRQYL